MACSRHNCGSDGDGRVDEGARAGYTHMRARRGEATDRHNIAQMVCMYVLLTPKLIVLVDIFHKNVVNSQLFKTEIIITPL
jgi:hypothetical protein